MTEIELIEKAVQEVGIQSLLNTGAASCIYSEGCNGVTQDHLVALVRKIALHCAVALAAPSQPEGAEPVAQATSSGICGDLVTVRMMRGGQVKAGDRLYLHPSQSAGAAAPDEGERWEPVATAPEGEAVLVYMSSIDAIDLSHQTDEGRWISSGGTKWPPGVITNWRPLPSAPKGEEPS